MEFSGLVTAPEKPHRLGRHPFILLFTAMCTYTVALGIGVKTCFT